MMTLSIGAARLAELTRTIAPDVRVSELAGVVGVSRATIYSWLRGDTSPSIEQATVMEAKYGIPLRDWSKPVPAEDSESGPTPSDAPDKAANG